MLGPLTPNRLGGLRPARRGAARAADERHVLLPLRADRAVGHDAAGDARLPVVPPDHQRRLPVGGGRRNRGGVGAPGRADPGSARRRARTAQRGGGQCPGHPLDPAPDARRPLRPAAHQRGHRRGIRRHHPHGLRRRALRAPRRGRDPRPDAGPDPHRALGTVRPAAGHAPPDGGRGRGPAPGQRGGDHPARRCPGDPGDPLLADPRARRPHRLAGRAVGPSDRTGAGAGASRPEPRLDAGFDGRRGLAVAIKFRSPFHRAGR